MENTGNIIKSLFIATTLLTSSCEEPDRYRSSFKKAEEQRLTAQQTRDKNTPGTSTGVLVGALTGSSVVGATTSVPVTGTVSGTAQALEINKNLVSEKSVPSKEDRVKELLNTLDKSNVEVLYKQIREIQNLEEEGNFSEELKTEIKKKIDPLYVKYKKKFATLLAWEVYQATCGKPPARSAWDNSIPVVKDFVKAVANDPDSIEFVGCKEPVLNKKNCYKTVCVFRGKNLFGGMVINAKTFYLTNNRVLNVED